MNSTESAPARSRRSHRMAISTSSAPPASAASAAATRLVTPPIQAEDSSTGADGSATEATVTSRLQRAVTVASVAEPSAPVLLSSAWMGGVTSLVAAALAAEAGGADEVEIAIRWDLRDRAGADSVEFMDRLGLDYEV